MAELENTETGGVVAPDVAQQIPGPSKQDGDGQLIHDDKPKTVREGIHAAIKEVREKETKKSPMAGGKEADAPKSPSLGAAASASTDSKERGPDGKFLPKADAATTEPTNEIPAPTPAAQPSTAMPEAWGKDKAPLWDALSPEAKALVVQREEQVTKGFKEYGDFKRRYQELDSVLAPARPVFQQNGMRSDAEAIQRLLTWQQAIHSNPHQAIAQLAQLYGVNLQSPARGPDQPQAGDGSQQAPQQFVDQAARQELQRLRAEQEQRTATEVSTSIQRFASEMDNGKPKYPHFEKVKEEMGRLMLSGVAADLPDAYDKAVWANPTMRDEMLRERETKAEADRKKAQADAVAKAKLANVSVRSGPSGASVANGVNKPKKGASVRDSIRSAIEEVEGRA